MRTYFTKYSGKIRSETADAIDIMSKKYIIRIRTGGVRITKKNGKLIFDRDLNLED